MLNLTIAFILSVIVCPAAPPVGIAQGEVSPAKTVQEFYGHLRARRYLEGFRLSVYGAAVEGLSEEERRELEPEFARMAKALPEQVETRGEQISGETATVFIKLPQEKRMQEVSLVRIDGKWRVGDRETYQLVVREGRGFFFNARLRVGEAEAYEWLLEIVGAQAIHFSSKQRYGTLEDLVALGGVSKQLVNGSESGYRFRLAVSEDGKGYRVHAVPAEYGRTGRLSFYADQTNAIRAEDKEGQPAAATAPLYRPEKN